MQLRSRRDHRALLNLRSRRTSARRRRQRTRRAPDRRVRTRSDLRHRERRVLRVEPSVALAHGLRRRSECVRGERRDRASGRVREQERVVACHACDARRRPVIVQCHGRGRNRACACAAGLPWLLVGSIELRTDDSERAADTDGVTWVEWHPAVLEPELVRPERRLHGTRVRGIANLHKKH